MNEEPLMTSAHSTIKYLFDILLLLVNSVGIIGALIQVLGFGWYIMPWYEAADSQTSVNGNMLHKTVFWTGLFLFCVLAVIAGNVVKKKGRIIYTLCCAALYVFVIILFREEIAAELSWILQDIVANLNYRHQFHISWQDDFSFFSQAGWDNGTIALGATLSILLILFPLIFLAGFFWNRGRCICLAVGNILWFTVACTFDVFPDLFYLGFCVIGLVAALVQKDFEAQPGAGFQALTCVVSLTGLVMGGICLFILPIVDKYYAEMEDDRFRFYQMVNEQWIPGFRAAISNYNIGLGTGTNVTGSLSRTNVFAYTAGDMYRVTQSSRPQGAVYLKGFVGAEYNETEWEALTDEDFINYYREHGLELPKDYSELVNFTWEALNELTEDSVEEDYIWIEELGGRSDYSVYPYGALIPEGYQVYSNGSVVRKGKEYGFHYLFLNGYNRSNPLTGQAKEVERQYRQYVYDTFLDYPAERLPLLTKVLEQEEIRTDNIYVCVLDIMEYLEKQAVYNLDAGRNPADKDFVEYFLFESHEGYCMHFASAAVLALRYFGIPARYVTGYSASPTEFARNEEGKYVAVFTGKHAHAWAEIYLDAIGWVPVEMTPGAAALAQDTRRSMLGRVGLLAGEDPLVIEKLNQSIVQEIEESSGMDDAEEEDLDLWEEEEKELPTSTPEEKEDFDEEQVLAAEGKEGTASNQPGVWQTYRGYLLLPAVGVGLLVLGCIVQSRRLRRWKGMLDRENVNERIFVLYRNLRKALYIAGCPKTLNVVSEEFWQQLQRICPQMSREEYENLCTILEKSSFAQTEPSMEEFRMVRALYDRLVNEVYEKAPFYERLYLRSGGIIYNSK